MRRTLLSGLPKTVTATVTAAAAIKMTIGASAGRACRSSRSSFGSSVDNLERWSRHVKG